SSALSGGVDGSSKSGTEPSVGGVKAIGVGEGPDAELVNISGICSPPETDFRGFSSFLRAKKSGTIAAKDNSTCVSSLGDDLRGIADLIRVRICFQVKTAFPRFMAVSISTAGNSTERWKR